MYIAPTACSTMSAGKPVLEQVRVPGTLPIGGFFEHMHKQVYIPKLGLRIQLILAVVEQAMW